jgi:putative isomerase
MNCLVYLALENYDNPQITRDFAQKSNDLCLKEWKQNGHVHENPLGYIQHLQQIRTE